MRRYKLRKDNYMQHLRTARKLHARADAAAMAGRSWDAAALRERALAEEERALDMQASAEPLEDGAGFDDADLACAFYATACPTGKLF